MYIQEFFECNVFQTFQQKTRGCVLLSIEFYKLRGSAHGIVIKTV